MNAPELRPKATDGAASTGESAPEQQLEHQLQQAYREIAEAFTVPRAFLNTDELTSPNFVALRRWIRVNRPDLYERLPGDDLTAGLALLNAETGLSITDGDVIETTAPLILAALQAKHAEKSGFLTATDRDGTVHTIGVVTDIKITRRDEKSSGLGDINCTIP